MDNLEAIHSSEYVKMSTVHKWNVPPTYSNTIQEFINTSEVKINRHCYEFDDDPRTADLELKKAVETDIELKSHFQQRCLPILKSSDYDILKYEQNPVIVGSGTFSYTIIGRERKNGDLVAIKVQDRSGKENRSLVSLLFEFMYQDKAHNALRGKLCTAPKPLGFLRVKHSADDVAQYTLVSEFCSVIPNVGVGMTLHQAFVWNNRKSFITTEEWRDICLALLEAMEIFRFHSVFHLDIKTDNIMLHFSTANQQPIHSYQNAVALKKRTSKKERNVSPLEQNPNYKVIRTSRVQPIIIDYGRAESAVRTAGGQNTQQEHPPRPVELCSFKNTQLSGLGNYIPKIVWPHPIYDLHSVAYVISTISKHLNMKILTLDIEGCMALTTHQIDVGTLTRCVELRFDEFIGQVTLSEFLYKPSKK